LQHFSGKEDYSLEKEILSSFTKTNIKPSTKLAISHVVVVPHWGVFDIFWGEVGKKGFPERIIVTQTGDQRRLVNEVRRLQQTSKKKK